MNVQMQAKFAMAMPHAQILLAATTAPVTLGLKEMEHVVMVYVSCHNRSRSRTNFTCTRRITFTFWYYAAAFHINIERVCYASY